MKIIFPSLYLLLGAASSSEVLSSSSERARYDELRSAVLTHEEQAQDGSALSGDLSMEEIQQIMKEEMGLLEYLAREPDDNVRIFKIARPVANTTSVSHPSISCC